MTTTTIPVGSTGLLLEGLLVDGAIRESVVQADPTDPLGFAKVVSSAPASDAYGSVTRIAGTPSVSVAALPGLQIVSSIPFYVAQSSAPWTVNGAVAVTSNVTIQGTSSVNVLGTITANVTNVPLVTVQGTSSVNVISSAPHAIVGTVSTQIVSSIPFFVAQSSAPWTMNGGVAVTNSPNVNVTNVPAVNITSSIPFFVAQSSGPWSMSPTGTTMVNIVSTVPLSSSITSSIPFFVAQSSAPWSVQTKQALQALAPTSTNITTTSAQLAGSNAARKGLSVTNMGANNLSLAFGTTAIANMGMTLAPYGTFTMAEYDFTTTSVNAIANGTTTPVGVQEYQ